MLRLSGHNMLLLLLLVVLIVRRGGGCHEHKRPIVVVVVGSWRGNTASLLLEDVQRCGSGGRRLFRVHCSGGSTAHQVGGMMRPTGRGGRR